MKALETYLSVLKKDIPDIEQRLNAGVSDAELAKAAARARCALPEEFAALYRRFDGEDASEYVSFFAGMEFLPLDRVMSELDFFRSFEEEMTAMGTTAIREEPVCELDWIPFAVGGPRAWLVMDLSPAAGGTAGQIITVDIDCDQCYLLAESLEGLFERMTQWLQEGVITVSREEAQRPELMEKTGGHIFDVLDDLALMETSDSDAVIALPQGYWQSYFGVSSIPQSSLEKEKKMYVGSGKAPMDVDCRLFVHMKNLKELTICGGRLIHLGVLARVPQLKVLRLDNCTFGEETLAALSGSPNLKELRIIEMGADGLTGLSRSRSLRSLTLNAAANVVLEDLGGFTGLFELDLIDMGLHDGTFLGNLKALKKLKLNRHHMDDLDFLACLKDLTAFELYRAAKNEDGLSCVSRCKKLKTFCYPVKDLSVYKGNTRLKEVGIAACAKQGFEVFRDSSVTRFILIGDDTVKKVELDRLLEKTAEKMRQYVELESYGWSMWRQDPKGSDPK